MIIIQLSIEEKTLPFKKSFKTDKYISTVEWYRIMLQLNKVIDDVLENKTNWHDKPKGNFKINESALQTKYQILPIEKSYINCSKAEYELGWFLKVLISSDMVKFSSSSEAEPMIKNIRSSSEKEPANKIKKEATDNQLIKVESTECDDFEKLIDSTKLKENHDQNLILLSDEDSDRQDNKRLKTDLGAKYSLRNTSKEVKTGTLDTWLTKKDQAEMARNITKRKQTPKATVKRTDSEPLKSRFDSKKLEKLKETQDELIPKFIEAQKQKEKLHEERKEELRNLDMLDCKYFSNQDLTNFIHSRKDKILELFKKEYKKGSKSLREELDCDVDFIIITTAEILSEDQQLFIMTEIQNLLDPSEKGTGSKDLLLHELIIPYVIIEVFKETYHFNTKEAIARIKTQEEKRDMFQENSSRISF